jgi:hypothetical protein
METNQNMIEDVLVPLFESSTVYASSYCKACNRYMITVTDMEYGWKYAARNSTKRMSHCPDDDGVDVIDETFTRYTGNEALYVDMNRCYDTWNQWKPVSNIEKILKMAIDKKLENNGRVHT